MISPSNARMRGGAAPSACIVESKNSVIVTIKDHTLRSWTTDRKKFVWKLINMQLIVTFHTIPVCFAPWFELGDAWSIFHQICEYTNIIYQICKYASISHILLSNLQIYQHLIYWICVPASTSSYDAGLAHISKFNRRICTHLRCNC